MSKTLPVIYLARHGETAWSLSGQHTGLTDLPLTERGERNARSLGDRLRGLGFTKVFTSPLQRAARTCELAGFSGVAEVDRDLVEWNYGEYEARTSDDIHRERPDWELFHDGVPGGETLAEIGARADRVVAHSDIAPARKRDPGERFPWDLLHDAGIGHWVAPAPDAPGPCLGPGDAGEAVQRLKADLAAYGYAVPGGAAYDADLELVVAAFQRHFRPARVDGIADPATCATLRALIAARPADASLIA